MLQACAEGGDPQPGQHAQVACAAATCSTERWTSWHSCCSALSSSIFENCQDVSVLSLNIVAPAGMCNGWCPTARAACPGACAAEQCYTERWMSWRSCCSASPSAAQMRGQRCHPPTLSWSGRWLHQQSSQVLCLTLLLIPNKRCLSWVGIDSSAMWSLEVLTHASAAEFPSKYP